MMSLCGSNFVPILITLLCCASLFMYFNLRLNEIKTTVEKQNRVLTAFITNVQQDIRASGGGGGGGCMLANPAAGLATPEALAAAKKIESDKIVVSDDEEDSDSDSSSESESETDDDGDEEEVENVVKNIKIVNLPDFELDEENVIKPIPIAFEVLSFSPIELASSGEPASANESSITEIIDEHSNLADTTSFEQMKVDELRKVVSDRNLASKDEVKKLKKPELLVLLKK
jgi:hypothetical protein